MAEQARHNNKISPALLVIIFFTLMAVVAVITMTVVNRSQPVRENAAAIVEGGAQFDGVTELEATPIENFTLTAADGEAEQFSTYKGKFKLIYFGYTFCPEFCPSTMTDFKQIKRELGDGADNIVFMMISVDGERDTPEVLGKYLSRFDPAFVGLTGTTAQVQPATEQFGVYFEKFEDEGSPYYMVDHNPSIFLVDRQNNLIAEYAYATEVGVIVEDLRTKLQPS